MTTRTSEPTEQAECDASAGWRAEYAYQGVDTSIEADLKASRRDRLAAADREDRSHRYRCKHRRGVTT